VNSEYITCSSYCFHDSTEPFQTPKSNPPDRKVIVHTLVACAHLNEGSALLLFKHI